MANKELISKLENPKDPETENRGVKQYTITPSGVLLRKGELMGMFLMGSSIAILAECPQDYEFRFKSGDRVLKGNELLTQVKGENKVEAK